PRARGFWAAVWQWVGAFAIPGGVETLPRHHRLHGCLEEPTVDLEPGRVAGRLAQTPLLLKQQHAEPVEARIGQRFAVLGDVGAETAGTTRNRGQKHVLANDVRDRHAFLGAEGRQLFEQVAYGEGRRV